MSRYGPHPHPSYYYYHNLYSRPYCRGRGWFGLSHIVALGIGLWAGSHFNRHHDYRSYWWTHRFDKDFYRTLEDLKKHDLPCESPVPSSLSKQP